VNSTEVVYPQSKRGSNISSQKIPKDSKICMAVESSYLCHSEIRVKEHPGSLFQNDFLIKQR